MRGFNLLWRLTKRLLKVIGQYSIFIIGMFPVISWGVVGYWFLSGFDVDEFIEEHKIVGTGIVLSAFGTLCLVIEAGIRSALGTGSSFTFLGTALVGLLVIAILGKVRKQTKRIKKLEKAMTDMANIIEQYEKESENTEKDERRLLSELKQKLRNVSY
jgi:hypothetical protein